MRRVEKALPPQPFVMLTYAVFWAMHLECSASKTRSERKTQAPIFNATEMRNELDAMRTPKGKIDDTIG